MEAGKVRVRMGRPEDMLPEVRDKGVEHVIANDIPESLIELCRASGQVTDVRRLVQYVYLLLHDCLTFGQMGEVMLRLEKGGPPVRYSYDERRLALRVAGGLLPLRLLAWIRHVRAYVEWDRLLRIAKRLPEDDGVTVVFTNGWLARYAQFVADTLVSRGHRVPGHPDGEATKPA
jgi:hypothetical protein